MHEFSTKKKKNYAQACAYNNMTNDEAEVITYQNRQLFRYFAFKVRRTLGLDLVFNMCFLS